MNITNVADHENRTRSQNKNMQMTVKITITLASLINPSISPHGVLLWHEGSASTAIRRSV